MHRRLSLPTRRRVAINSARILRLLSGLHTPSRRDGQPSAQSSSAVAPGLGLKCSSTSPERFVCAERRNPSAIRPYTEMDNPDTLSTSLQGRVCKMGRTLHCVADICALSLHYDGVCAKLDHRSITRPLRSSFRSPSLWPITDTSCRKTSRLHCSRQPSDCLDLFLPKP